MTTTSIIRQGLICFIIASLCSCGGKKETGGDTGGPTTPEKNEASSEINKMIVYIDASASIKGYFSNGSDGKFGNAITNLAQYNGLNSPVYFWGDSKQISTTIDASGGTNASLRRRSGFGQDSYFNIIFAGMVDLVVNDSVDAAFLVTDGIYGAGNKLVKKDPQHVAKTLSDFKGAITNVFLNKGIAVGVFKLSAKFSSTSKNDAYITYQNSNEYPITIENRPFYVIIIGKADKINGFAKNNNLGADLSLILGAHDIDLHNSHKLSDTRLFDKNNVWNGDKNNSETNLCLNIPSCIGNDNFIKNNISVTLNGKEINNFTISKSRLTITEEIERNASVRPKKESVFQVVIKNSIPTEWTSLYNEDDKNIKNDQSIQGQTFGLKYLLEGLLEGTCSDNLIDISFKFKKK